MTRRSPRPPQPAIDHARITPGSRWQKNRAEDIGKPPIFVIVDEVVCIATYEMVHYHNEATSRRAHMPLRDFCAGSEHREPDPPTSLVGIEDAPVSGPREIEAPVDLARMFAMVSEIHAVVCASGQRVLPLVGAR
jgi:hypothetical protein